MALRKALAFFIFFASALLADTYTQTFNSGTIAGGTSIYLTTDITTDINASAQTTYCPGSQATISYNFGGYSWGAGTFSATSYVPSNAGSSGSGSLGATNINLISSSDYNSKTWYYDNCAAYVSSSYSFKCSNIDSSSRRCRTGSSYSACDGDLLSGSSASRTVYYTDGISNAFNGVGSVGSYCSGYWYVNGAQQGEITGSGSATVTLPSTPQNYPVTVSAIYSCMFVLKEYYLLSGTTKSYKDTLYAGASQHTSQTTLNINVLNPLPSMSVSVSPSPITLTGGSASITLTVTNTGNVPIRVTNIVPNQGTFTPSSPFPSPLIAPGGSLPITGTYSYGGATPTTTTFTVSGASNVCGATYTATATASVSVISGCLYANISILGIMPSPIVFSGNTASVTLTIQNTGDVALNVTSFGASTDFTFTPSDTLPVEMSAGATRAFSGTLTYTGGSMPPNVTITAYGSTTAAVCGPSSVNASITAQISTVTGVDLAVDITANDTSMTQLEQGYSNVTVRNIGSNATTSSSTLTVTIMHCNDGSLTDCPGNTEVNTYSIPALAAGASYIQRTIDYWCENYKYIGIRANATAPVSETDTTNNVDTIAIPCSMESCAISGPALIESPATYTFTAKCLRSDGSEMVCDDLLDGNFGWSRAANPSGTIGFGTENYAGDAFENYSMQITSIIGNGTLSIDATATTQAGNDISCSNDFQVAANECVNQV